MQCYIYFQRIKRKRQINPRLVVAVGLFDAYEAVSRITTGVQSGTGTENVGASKHSISGGESIISQPKRDEGTDRAKSPKHEPVIKQKPKRHTTSYER